MRVPNAVIRRPASSAARRPRTRTEAAIELVRAEFERERLERDMEFLRRRFRISAAARNVAAARSRVLRDTLADEPPVAKLPSGKPAPSSAAQPARGARR
jgi:hypothetical protein